VVARIEFCLLGPLLVRADGAVVPVPPGNQRTVLAALLLSAGQTVAVGEIAEALWGPAPPPSARVSVQNYVMRLRRALGEAGRDRVTTQPRGYLIRVNPGELDLTRFAALLATANSAARDGSWDTAADQAQAALSLWRGEPLADVDSEVLALREGPRLADMRLQAVQTRIDADLHLGRHAEVIAELQHLTASHPLREPLHALLMLALYRAGRQADALAAYRHARGVLIDELGAEPGSRLRELHQQILAADAVLSAPEPARLTAGGPRLAVPRELPAGIWYFTGRAEELNQLTGLMDQAGEAPGTVVISAIGGTAGVGKTALAVHWAHQVAGRFGDGQLYVNLRGYDPSGIPVAAARAVRSFLDALGVPAERIPAGLDAQAGLYRSLLAGKRILVVLDNASDAAQVRPLLPGAPGCLVVVTSRSQLAGLVAAEGARLLTLDVLTHEEARELLARRLGAERVAAEAEAVTELIALCARLPLALSITAARSSARPGLRLAALAAELRDARDRLDALDAGETATSTRAVFSWSGQQLSDPAGRMFRMLGLHPGPDITAPAAASLAGVPLRQARLLLGELAGASLLAEHAPGRYAFHDLLRAYAAEQAEARDSEADRRAALHRMLDHYLHTAHAAARLLEPSRYQVTPGEPVPGAAPERLAGHGGALAWFDAEHHVLLAVIALAAGTGFGTCAWQIPWTLADYFNRRGYWYDWAATQHTALAAAQRSGDTTGQAHAHRELGHAYDRLGVPDKAHAHLGQALGLFRRLGDARGQASSHMGLGVCCAAEGRYDHALSHTQQALDLYRQAGFQAGQAAALNNIGWCHAQLGSYEQAVDHCQRALDLQRELGDRHGEANTWDSIGYARHHLGHHTDAISCYRHALGLFRELGDRYNQADTLTRLGDTYHAAGDPRAARDAWQQALAILDDLDHPDASQVRAKLRDLGASSSR
jgi:DNA-binding SARP family transcriptional activator/Tfp pilus assembly protein PilF